MSYTINHTNGLNPIVIADGTINTSNSVTLVGKNFPNYGQILDQNFLKLLENSSNTTAPNQPTTGELWWDSGNNILKVWNGSVWKNVGSTTASPTAPTGSNNIGDLWWNTSSGQLYGYDGITQQYKLIGPIGGTGGITSEIIIDSNNGSNAVLSMTIGNNRYVILSNSPTFIPKTPINGFPTINPGLNLASTSFLSNAKFYGQSYDAATVDGLNSSSFMRSDTNTSTSGTISVLNNNGLYVGSSSSFHVSVSSGANVSIANETASGVMNFKVRNSSGTQLDAMDIYPNGNVVANFDLTVAGNISFSNTTNDLVITGTSRSINYATGALRLSIGGLGVAGNINSGGSNSNFVGNLTANNIISNNSVNATTVTASTIAGTLTTNAQPYVTSLGTLSSLTVSSSISGATLYGTIATNVQPYITSVGTLTSLAVSGALNAATLGGTVSTNAQPYINSVGSLTGLTVTGITNLGVLGNVRITGGSAGQYLQTDGTGSLSWTTISNTGTGNTVAFYNGSGQASSSTNLAWNGNTFAVNGAITATGDVTAFSTSDVRLKTDIEPITDALDKVSSLQGITFGWNEIGISMFDPDYPPPNREVGVIAQQVEEVLPEVVTTRDNGYLAVNYEKIVPLLIEAIKELKQEINSLKSTLKV
jgi:Chaperone of endosialidase